MTALTQALATDLAWFLVILTVLVWAGVILARIIHRDRLDAMPDPGPVCGIGDCHQPAAGEYHAQLGGPLLICDAHATRIGRPAERVYDQELHGTDLALWEKEL